MNLSTDDTDKVKELIKTDSNEPKPLVIKKKKRKGVLPNTPAVVL